MALTGTSTKKVKADITTHIHLSDEDTDIVYKSPDRPNIFIQILKRKFWIRNVTGIAYWSHTLERY